jgi:hypothetical protein
LFLFVYVNGNISKESTGSPFTSIYLKKTKELEQDKKNRLKGSIPDKD